ncbi:tail tape measure protein [Alteraurantiacibacter aquimixticola]|uniref:Tail tape measure protein n=1 Tax=Alteraurantiacibacter aquimixticola TaxID=2489173 RepID=A0A4T3EXK2_9SPHN|nr:tail tape measure protein [Alteraurantiacibacter aquimixticola]TIX49378.1 tail tape measure protein [Alteraurantiacibacter aquimixticola]
MDDEIDTLMVDVRASTDGFRADIEGMRTTLDSNLVDGFQRAGAVLERGLLSAVRRGSLGFDDLKRVALSTLNEIASQALTSGISQLFGSGGGQGGGGGFGQLFSSLIGTVLDLPGRATGGPVAPGQAYLVGERGPELFVPTSAGRVEANGAAAQPQRDVRVAINLASPRGTDVPVALRRSSRQLASQVRRALQQA